MELRVAFSLSSIWLSAIFLSVIAGRGHPVPAYCPFSKMIVITFSTCRAGEAAAPRHERLKGDQDTSGPDLVSFPGRGVKN
jgi:hypothetical protein